jgi:ATP-dependent Clp protease ATP-binding subunit ClpC
MVSPEVNALVERAVGHSVRQGLFFVGVDHLFAALFEEPEALPTAVREQHLNALTPVLREMGRTPWTRPVRSSTGEVFHTPRCIAALTQAGHLAERMNGGAASAGHVLLAILSDSLSAPSRAMDRLAIDRGAVLQTLRQSLASSARRNSAMLRKPPETAAAHETPHETPHEQALPPLHERSSSLATLTRNLEKLAHQGKLEPAIGRDKEIFEILQVLTRKNKNNVMLVGEAGVGKTQVVEGLALALAHGLGGAQGPTFHLLELNLAALMSGTQYRGALEEKLLSLIEQLKERDDVVLFIDEAHLIMGAGATDGGSVDLANLLKPALARGEIRCIGATTLQEYRRFVEKDPAIERRFQMVRIEELSEEASLQVLMRLRPSLERHHEIKISTRAVHATVKLTQRYMPNRRLPDKAIDVLDQACARFRLKLLAARGGQSGVFDSTLPLGAEDKVTPHDIRKVVSQITAVPIEEMTAEERVLLIDLDKRLKTRLIGQDEAVSRVVSVVKKSRAGLSDPNRPDAVMLFLGPSGVGKTELAKLLAAHLFGSLNHLTTFDMSEYVEEHSVSRLLGAPPGYAGCEEEGRLTAAVRNSPFSILLFDEIEKAHPRIFDIFLPIFDEGRLKDSRGREASFKNCIILLTSNIGAEVLSRDDRSGIDKALMDALRGHFRPEFINRIDEIVPFYPLLTEDIRSILRLEINILRERLRERKIGVRMYQRAYEFLAAQGYNPEFGARELRRTVDKLVATPISQGLIGGDFVEGDMIDVLIENGELVFRKGRPHHEEAGAPA